MGCLFVRRIVRVAVTLMAQAIDTTTNTIQNGSGCKKTFEMVRLSGVWESIRVTGWRETSMGSYLLERCDWIFSCTLLGII